MKVNTNISLNVVLFIKENRMDAYLWTRLFALLRETDLKIDVIN